MTDVLSARPKPWLEAWYCKWGVLAGLKTKAATNIGSAFHSAIEQKWEGKLPNRVQNMYSRWLTWARESDFLSIDQELHVVSEMYHYHGTFDAIGTLGRSKEVLIFDWKTSSAIYPDMALQLSAYAQAYKEQTGVEIKRGLIVHVSKDKPHHKLTVKEYTLGKRLFNKFLKRLNEYDELKEAGV